METPHPDERLINSLKTAFVWERRHSSVGLERLICNSSLTNCAAFHCFAQHCRRQVIRNFHFAVRCAELRGFASKFRPTVEYTVENFGLP